MDGMSETSAVCRVIGSGCALMPWRRDGRCVSNELGEARLTQLRQAYKMSSVLYYGSFVHSTSLTTLEQCTSSLIYVSKGLIQWVEKHVESSRVQEVAASHGLMLDDVDVVELGGDFLVPGLVDTHTVSFLPSFAAHSKSLTDIFSTLACASVP